MTAREKAERMVEVVPSGDRYVLRWAGCKVHMMAPDDPEGAEARRRIAVDVLATAFGDVEGRPLRREDVPADEASLPACLGAAVGAVVASWLCGVVVGWAAHAASWGGR